MFFLLFINKTYKLSHSSYSIVPLQCRLLGISQSPSSSYVPSHSLRRLLHSLPLRHKDLLLTHLPDVSLLFEQRPLLLQVVCAFLESNGFAKTLQNFLSESSLEHTKMTEGKDSFNMDDIATDLPAVAALSREDRAALLNALKTKLRDLSGNTAPVLESLKPMVRKRVEALRQLQTNMDSTKFVSYLFWVGMFYHLYNQATRSSHKQEFEPALALLM